MAVLTQPTTSELGLLQIGPGFGLSTSAFNLDLDALVLKHATRSLFTLARHTSAAFLSLICAMSILSEGEWTGLEIENSGPVCSHVDGVEPPKSVHRSERNKMELLMRVGVV